MMATVKDGAAVAVGVIGPQLALRQPQLLKFADTPVKKALAKALIGYGMSRLAKRFAGGRIASMILIGTASNIILADILPKAAPSLGLGMADAYDQEQFPTLNEMTQAYHLAGGGKAYGGRDEDLSEMAYY